MKNVKIETLQDAIDILIVASEGIQRLLSIHKKATTPEPVKESTNIVTLAEVFPAEPGQVKLPTEDITLEGLQNLCLNIVKTDPGKKTAIKSIIKRFGGNLLKDLDPKHYVEVKNLLEAL